MHPVARVPRHHPQPRNRYRRHNTIRRINSEENHANPSQGIPQSQNPWALVLQRGAFNQDRNPPGSFRPQCAARGANIPQEQHDCSYHGGPFAKRAEALLRGYAGGIVRPHLLPSAEARAIGELFAN